MNQAILTVLQTALACGNLAVMLWALKNFLKKPQEDLKAIVQKHDDEIKEIKALHEVEMKEIKASLLQGNDRFREQYSTNEVLIRSVFALLEFEVHYCETEHKPISKNLEKAKDELHEYLAKQRLD